MYVELNKALYGTLKAALLWWQDLSRTLIKLGFTINPYDWCVANKIIDGKQCTIVWHVDDLKISHVSEKVVSSIVDKLNKRYGKVSPLTVHKGPTHDYLGMDITYPGNGTVEISMDQYVRDTVNEAPDDMNGEATTPANNNLFKINDESEKLSNDDAEMFHHLVAKLLFVCKQARPDIQTAVAFLCTRVKSPNKEDWIKLGRVIKYLRAEPNLSLTLELGNDKTAQWWIDGAFAVHHDMRSHTGSYMSLGKGMMHSQSSKQKMTTRSSTEAELVAVDDVMSQVMWTRNFLKGQGYDIGPSVVFQDNQSAMLLEKNGRSSMGKRTRHLKIRYFFVKDQIDAGRVVVKYCPTDYMVGDFFTKPLQGSKFRMFRQVIMNLKHDASSLVAEASQECVGKNVSLTKPAGHPWTQSVVQGQPDDEKNKKICRGTTANQSVSWADVVRRGKTAKIAKTK